MDPRLGTAGGNGSSTTTSVDDERTRTLGKERRVHDDGFVVMRSWTPRRWAWRVFGFDSRRGFPKGRRERERGVVC